MSNGAERSFKLVDGTGLKWNVIVETDDVIVAYRICDYGQHENQYSVRVVGKTKKARPALKKALSEIMVGNSAYGIYVCDVMASKLHIAVLSIIFPLVFSLGFNEITDINPCEKHMVVDHLPERAAFIKIINELRQMSQRLIEITQQLELKF